MDTVGRAASAARRAVGRRGSWPAVTAFRQCGAAFTQAGGGSPSRPANASLDRSQGADSYGRSLRLQDQVVNNDDGLLDQTVERGNLADAPQLAPRSNESSAGQPVRSTRGALPVFPPVGFPSL